jgi:tRNA pseudouridine32 synthase / 23S rRNA pseudouridine746 synthase
MLVSLFRMNDIDNQIFHPFVQEISQESIPEKFTYPFYYTPHPLCLMAAKELQHYLLTQIQWKEELTGGKMFGVLIVRNVVGNIGYLAAFSGNLAHSNVHPFFVPPVFDFLQPDDFFPIEEKQISSLNKTIDELQGNIHYRECKERLAEETERVRHTLDEAKADLKSAKAAREERRKSNPDDSEVETMIKESQFQKAEYKRLERSCKQSIASIELELNSFDKEIALLTAERKSLSAALQQQLFDRFQFLNALGETKGLCDIFAQTAQRIPPAGAGECAAPKLLQYAFLHKLHPIAMAEFWWGESPKTEIRIHGHYYPACKGKCEPILQHMLKGLDVEDNPLSRDVHRTTELEVLWEDDYLLVVNKPAGMLSVPGKINVDSVLNRMQRLYPEATGPMIVHRLDMATSGLLLIAKTKDVHKDLQAQFRHRTVKKQYIALLDGIVNKDFGVIDLPLCLNPSDRPRQMVSTEYGKPAVTRYEVLDRTGSRTRVAFWPQTGRTHQLRMHAAHSDGLNAPIVGDPLYGTPSDRLYLHAESLEFTHPVSGERIKVEKKADF